MTTSKFRGHFSAILVKRGELYVPTTLTNARKRTGKAKEMAKRSELLRELNVQAIARKIDGVSRRWSNVKANGPDG